VQNKGQSSAPINLSVVATAPGIFLSKTIGTSNLAILNTDQSINSQANPAASSPVTMFATGEGIMKPPVATGSVATSSPTGFPKPVAAVSLTIAGNPAPVVSASQGTGLFSGILQIVANIPAGTASGPQPVVLTIGNTDSSLETVTLFIA
jgi:uncharacterized protein (TIGR03437 family)